MDTSIHDDIRAAVQARYGTMADAQDTRERNATLATATRLPAMRARRIGRRALLHGTLAVGTVIAAFGWCDRARAQAAREPEIGLREWMTTPGRGQAAHRMD